MATTDRKDITPEHPWTPKTQDKSRDSIFMYRADWMRYEAAHNAMYERLKSLIYVVERTPLFGREGYDKRDVEAYIEEARAAIAQAKERAR